MSFSSLSDNGGVVVCSFDEGEQSETMSRRMNNNWSRQPSGGLVSRKSSIQSGDGVVSLDRTNNSSSLGQSSWTERGGSSSSSLERYSNWSRNSSSNGSSKKHCYDMTDDLINTSSRGHRHRQLHQASSLSQTSSNNTPNPTKHRTYIPTSLPSNDDESDQSWTNDDSWSDREEPTKFHNDPPFQPPPTPDPGLPSIDNIDTNTKNLHTSAARQHPHPHSSNNTTASSVCSSTTKRRSAIDKGDSTPNMGTAATPGAYSSSGRAFGERPIWAGGRRRSSMDQSIESSFYGGGGHTVHSESESFRTAEEEEYIDPLNDTAPTNHGYGSNSNDEQTTICTDDNGFVIEADTAVVEMPADLMSHAGSVTSMGFMRWVSQRSVGTSRSKMKDLEHRKQTFFVLTAVLLLVVAVVGIAIPILIYQGRKQGESPELSPIALCIEHGRDVYPNGQPDIHCQCQLQGKITDILEKTQQRYLELQHVIAEALLPANFSTESSNSTVSSTLLRGGIVNELPVWNQTDCNHSQSMALLDMASRNKTDLERYGLMVLYFSMGMEFQNWDQISNETCDWPSVDCSTNDEDGMYSVSLSKESLTGTIPAEVGLLTNMKDLIIFGSPELVGTLPTEFGMLDQLKKLILQNCNLNGAIPTEIGSMSSLELLHLEKNRFGSTILSEIGRLERLHELDVGLNQLTGTLPLVITQLPSLTWLRVDENQMTGMIPSELGSLSALEKLGLRRNRFESALPTEIWGLKGLTLLMLGDLGLEGTIPWDMLVGMTDLETFHVDGNRFSGTISSYVGGLTSLTEFAINGNTFEGLIPTEVGLLTGLRSLSASENRLSGSIPSSLAALTNLKYLNLANNRALAGNMEDFCDLVASTQSEGLYRIDGTQSNNGVALITCSCCLKEHS